MNSIRPHARLRRAARASNQLAATRSRDPIARMDWLPDQLRFLQSRARVKLFRAGMQVLGKSTAALAEVVMLATASHPWQPGRFAEESWVVCRDFGQSVTIQKKLWELAPKHLVHPDCEFNDVTGFGMHRPSLQFVLPDGRTSIIKIKTTGQGAAALQSATIDHILIDELTSPDIFRACKKRVQARGGTVAMSLTPIDSPAEWLRELVEKKQVDDIHAPLTVASLIHTRSGRPRVLLTDEGPVVCDAAYIARVREESIGDMEAVEVDGEWEGRNKGAWFSSFDTTKHVSKFLPTGVVALSLGVDHGTAVGKQAAVLVAVDESTPDGVPAVYVLAEYVPTDATVPEDDARAILTMLQGAGIAWENLDHAYGDKPAEGGIEGLKKGNLDIADKVARMLGKQHRRQLRPQLLSVKEGRGAGHGAPERGVKWIHHQTIRDARFYVNPACVKLIKALQEWAGGKFDPHKDVIDALRYALRPWIFGERGRKGPVTLKNWGR